MSEFLIGEVCDFLKIKPHVLRYWEQHIALLQPTKNRVGRRVYSYKDIQMLFRFKYLLYSRMYTMEGAAKRIMEEAYGAPARYKTEIQVMRESLLRILGSLRSSKHIYDDNE